MRHIGLEGRCFVLSCNQFNRRSDFPPDFLDDEFNEMMLKKNGLTNRDDDYVIAEGGSCIVSPLGKFIAGPVYEKEETLFADLDLNDCIRGKLDLDVVGHYSRPDVFTLHVNSKQNTSVVMSNTSSHKLLQSTSADSKEETSNTSTNEL